MLGHPAHGLKDGNGYEKAVGYFEKGVLIEEDLEETDTAIEAQCIVHEDKAKEVLTEE